MLDIEYLKAPPIFDGPLIYRYRTGSFYPAMRAAVHANLGVGRTFRDGLSPTAGGFFDDDIPFIDWRNSRSGSAIIHHVVSELPETLLVVFAKYDCPIFRGASWQAIKSCCLIVDETRVTADTVKEVTEYLDASSVLGSQGLLSSQNDFLRHFVDFVGPDDVPLRDFVHAFNETVLLHVDRRTSHFRAPAPSLFAQRKRNEILKHLDNVLERLDDRSIIPLTVAFARRYPYADRGAKLFEDLAERCISRLTQMSSKAGKRPQTLQTRSLARSTFVLVGLMCAWSTAVQDEPTTRKQFGIYPSLSLVRFHQMLLELHSRLNATHSDPLHGLWSGIEYEIDQEGESPLYELLVATGNLLNQLPLDGVRWAEALKRHLQRDSRKQHGGSPGSDVLSIAEWAWPKRLLGIDSFAEFVARRSASGRGLVPLVLSGTKGAGKRTLGRYTAMSLLCDGPSAKPCITNCNACRGVISNALLDFIPIDASKLSADSIEQDLTQKLDDLRKAIRNKQIVVMLFHAEHISQLLPRYLKTLESLVSRETWVLCVEDVEDLHPAILSRSDVWHVERLTEDEAIEHVHVCSQGISLDDQLCEIIASAGRGVPARLQQLTSSVLTANAVTIDRGRIALGLDWGEPLLTFCENLLDERPDLSLDLEGVAHIVTLERLHIVLSEIRHVFLGGRATEPAFLYLDGSPLHRLAQILATAAARNGHSFQKSWQRLCIAWTADDLVEEDGLLALKSRSHSSLYPAISTSSGDLENYSSSFQ